MITFVVLQIYVKNFEITNLSGIKINSYVFADSWKSRKFALPFYGKI